MFTKKSLKDRLSDWYYHDLDSYTRQFTDELIRLGKDVYHIGPALAETFTPIYSDAAAATALLEDGVYDIKNANDNYLDIAKGVVKIASSPLLGAGLLAIPDGADAPIKAGLKTSNKVTLLPSDALLHRRGRRPSIAFKTWDDVKLFVAETVAAVKQRKATDKSEAVITTTDNAAKYKYAVKQLAKKDAKLSAKLRGTLEITNPKGAGRPVEHRKDWIGLENLNLADMDFLFHPGKGYIYNKRNFETKIRAHYPDISLKELDEAFMKRVPDDLYNKWVQTGQIKP